MGINRNNAGLPLPDSTAAGAQLVMTFLAAVLSSPVVLPSERARLISMLERISGVAADCTVEATLMARDYTELFGRDFYIEPDQPLVNQPRALADLAARAAPVEMDIADLKEYWEADIPGTA